MWIWTYNECNSITSSLEITLDELICCENQSTEIKITSKSLVFFIIVKCSLFSVISFIFILLCISSTFFIKAINFKQIYMCVCVCVWKPINTIKAIHKKQIKWGLYSQTLFRVTDSFSVRLIIWLFPPELNLPEVYILQVPTLSTLHQ